MLAGLSQEHRVLQAANAKGVVLVAAAGNAGTSRPLYPAADPNVIAVSATDAQDRAYRQGSVGSHIAVAAPGVDVLVAAPDKSYGLTSGSSVAVAHVAGVIALLLAQKPDLTPAETKALLIANARKVEAAPAEPRLVPGITDAAKALQAIAAKTVKLD